LSAVHSQTFSNYEVILVDNKSTDNTVLKAKKYGFDKLVSITNYLPGKALNAGIRESVGEYIVCLSGHCIPVDDFWLEKLVLSLDENSGVAGAYGRQEPMAFSTPSDKRDLLLVFGLDRKVQEKDSFFHNANSILRRSVWNNIPFDDAITNIEDRIWGHKVISLGYKILYEPEASVYHHHGIHQDGNVERCDNIVKIIEKMNIPSKKKGLLNAKKLNIIAIIPVKNEECIFSGKKQMEYTINSAIKSKYIDDIFVTTNSVEVAKVAESLGAKCPFIRSDKLANKYISLDIVVSDALLQLEEKSKTPIDLVVVLEETFPFRSRKLIDNVIDHMLLEGHDSVITVKPETGSLWIKKDSEKYERIDSGDRPRSFKEKSYIGIKGLCSVTYPEFLRQEIPLGNKVGLFEVDNSYSWIEVRDDTSREMYKEMIQKFNN
jgi:CMP-N-acetylneuraminic acid synthetase/GT2 family glycosyltransferase